MTLKFGCWPSTVHLARAWLGQVLPAEILFFWKEEKLKIPFFQPECRHEVGRGTVCLCSEELCNLRVPSVELQRPEGTEVSWNCSLKHFSGTELVLQVQFILVLCLLVLCLLMISIATFFHCKAWKSARKSAASADPEGSAVPPPPSPNRRCSRIPLLPPEQADWASSAPPPFAAI